MSYFDYVWAAVAFFGSPVMVLFYSFVLFVFSLGAVAALSEEVEYFDAPWWYLIVAGIVSAVLFVHLIAFCMFIFQPSDPLSWAT